MTFPKRLNKRLIKSIPKINSCDSMNIPFIIHHCPGNMFDFISHTIEITINWTTNTEYFQIRYDNEKKFLSDGRK